MNGYTILGDSTDTTNKISLVEIVVGGLVLVVVVAGIVVVSSLDTMKPTDYDRRQMTMYT